MDNKNFIARRVAKYFKAGDVVNLGIGLPLLVSNYVEDGILFHAENGMIGAGESAEGLYKVESFSNAGGLEIIPVSGACCFDSCMSFSMVRNGRIAGSVLGCFEVAENGDLANWKIPGKRVAGMGGAMDIVTGLPNIIVATEHCDKKGRPKIVKQCTLPLTGKGVVNHIVTELCVIDVVDEGLLLREIRQGISIEELQEKTEPRLIVADDLKIMEE